MRVLANVVLAVVLISGIVVLGFYMDWIVTGHNYALQSFWAPKFEDLRRDTYTHTESYRTGSVQRLSELCTQESQAGEDHRDLYRGTIRHEFATWDSSDVPAYLRACLGDARTTH